MFCAAALLETTERRRKGSGCTYGAAAIGHVIAEPDFAWAHQHRDGGEGSCGAAEPVRPFVAVLPFMAPGAEGPRAAVDAAPGSAAAALTTRLAEQAIERRRERAALRAASFV